MILNIQINKLGFEKELLMENFSLKLKKGDLLVLIGSTGCGKTTLLKAISGLIPEIQESIFSGKITYGKEEDLNNLRKHISFAFQEPENQFILSTLEHELFFSISRNKQFLADNLLKYFHVENLKSKSLKDLSTGQRKILSIISVLAQDKDIILLDEPTSNLDNEHRKRLVSHLKLISPNKIIVLCTHDDKLFRIGNKIISYNNGKWIKGNIPEKIKLVKFKEKKSRNDLIRFRNVHKTYSDRTIALKDINFNIKKGQIFGIFGPNGSGKTTLLNIITNNIKKSKGNINLNFKSCAMIMQEPEKQLFANSVLEELNFESNFTKKELLRVLTRINLEHKKEEHPFFLSRGQKQLLLIASTLMKKPELLIIDEPFAGLDSQSIKNIMIFIKEYYETENTTIIFSDQEDYILKDVVSGRIDLFNGRARQSNSRYQQVKKLDVSMLVVRPESMNRFEEIKSEVIRRGYKILNSYKLNKFSDKVSQMYSADYPDKKITDIFQEAYKKSNFGENFQVLILKHENGETIKRLNSDIGHFKAYQNKKDDSLRSMFGLPTKDNYINKYCSMVFCGLHRTDCIDAFIIHLDLFGIKDFV